MGPKSSVQTIVMDHLGSKYGHIRVKKRSFLPKNGQIDFFLVFTNSAHDDGFNEHSLTPLVRKKNSSYSQFTEMTYFDQNLTII